MLSRLALAGIGGYQRYLSPRKGYVCAHRVLHGGTGCSGHAKAPIATHGLIAAVPLIRVRFAACRDAAKELRDAPGRREKKKERWYDNCGGCDGGGCDLPFRGCGKGNAGPDCDCSPDCCSL